MQRNNKNYKLLQTRKNGFLGIWVCHLRENSHAPSPETSSSEILVLSKEACIVRLQIASYLSTSSVDISAAHLRVPPYLEFMTSYDTK